MKITEKTICSFNDKNNRLQLVQQTIKNQGITTGINGNKLYYDQYRYKVYLNRKIQGTNVFEYPMRKLFASLCQNITLQLKIY